MNSKLSGKRLALAVSLFAMTAFGATNTFAADLTWSGASGATWDTITPNWSGSIWNSATPDSAIFGTAATIQLPTTPDIVVDNFTTNAAVTLGTTSATVVSPEQSLTLNGGADGIVTFGGTNTLTIENNLRVSGAPTNGIVKTGTGRVFFKNQQNDFVGNFTINASGADTNGGSFQLGGIFTTQPVPALPTDGAFGAAANSFILNTNFTLFTNSGGAVTFNPLRTFTLNGTSNLTVNGQANNSRSVIISGSVLGTGTSNGLSVTGASTRLTLGGANTFAGDITVAGGGVSGTAPTQSTVASILTVGTGVTDTVATLGNGLNKVTINSALVTVNGVANTPSPGVLQFSRSDYTFGGNIGGGGDLRITNSGTITLTGNNTFTGQILINVGTLSVASSANMPDAANLRFSGGATLLIGGDFDATNAADFTRPLGTTAGTVRFSGGGGFAAKGADRIVDIGGAGASYNWGTTTNFLSNTSALLLSSPAATHTLIFKNPIDMSNAAAFAREFRTFDGAAAIDARLDGAISGDALQTFRKTNTGTLLLPVANSFSGPVIVDDAGGTLLVGNADALGTTTSLSIRTAATVKLQPSLAKAPVIGTGGDFAVSFVDGTGTGTTTVGTLDITNNGMVFDYNTIDPATALATVRALVISGRNGGDFLGKGITSSTAAAATPGTRTIGVLNTADLPVSSFLGQTPDSTAILVRYVLPGDTNLSGTVDFDDLLSLAQSYNTLTGARFDQGDVDYNGTVDFDDLLALAQNYNGTVMLGDISASPEFPADWALAQSLVMPEPATLGLFASSMVLMRRRRQFTA